MLELVFSDSGAAALAMTKKDYDSSKYTFSTITTDEDGNETIVEKEPKPYLGNNTDGTGKDILSIWLLGDIGDIQNLSNWSSRLKLLRKISDTHEFETDDWITNEGKRGKELVERLETAGNSGEPVRIWWSNSSGDTCGFYWAIYLLRHSQGNIHSIKMPDMVLKEDRPFPARQIGNLEPEDFSDLLPLERILQQKKRDYISSRWETLMAENAPLRAVINGGLLSVPEDFYDYVLYRVFPKGEFHVVDAIGLALLKGPPGLTDWWYAYRIRYFISLNKLEVIKSSKRFYNTTVRLS